MFWMWYSILVRKRYTRDIKEELKMTKRNICKKLYNELGDNELSNILLEALTAPKSEAFLFNERQVELFEKYAEECEVNRKAVKNDFYWCIA